MKIGLVITNFAESSLSLMEALSMAGHCVDLYYITADTHFNKIAAFEFDTAKRIWGGVYEINYEKSRGVSFCNNNRKTRIYVYQAPIIGDKKNGLSHIIAKIIFFAFASIYFLPFIKKQKYDCVDIISQSGTLLGLHKRLAKTPLVFSFHEVLFSHFENINILPVVKNAISNNENIRFFSEKSYNDVMNLWGNDNCKYRHFIIPFGVFNVYKDFGNDVKIPLIEKLENYILFFGFIRPYKGLPLLYQAISTIHKYGFNVHVVVAGSGSDPCLSRMIDNPNFTIINRFINNDETAYLMKRCRFVVCPYKSISQSGIPQTAFAFDKPIAASNIGVFSELIGNNERGILFDINNMDEMVTAIMRLYNDDVFYSSCCANIKDLKNTCSKYSWGTIVKDYEDMVKTLRQ